MSQVLYRKYRPQNFNEVLGQDHVVEILSKAIANKRISHAYLFSGPRGTGKTSVARILAKDIGCHEHDLWEMDAASSRGIDEIRSLRDGVYTLPFKSEYKVYIIDEAHMLTKEAFNALLKTLEEPPAHAVFILATTEPDKLPQTVVSRCQHFAFKKIPENILRESIIKIAKKEGVKIDGGAAGLVAFFSDGSFRDSQVMLDQLLNLATSGKDKTITTEEARKILSAPPDELVREFVVALVNKNSEAGMKIIGQVMEKGIGVQLFLKFVLRVVRSLMMIKLASESRKDLEEILGQEETNFLWELREKISVKDLGYILVLLLESYDKSGRGYLPQLPLELALAKMHLRAQNIEK